MEDRLRILQNILPTGLLAESISSLASSLGYKSRSSLYRIMEGKAAERSIEELYHKIETILFLSKDTIYNINAIIENTSWLIRLLKDETSDFKNHTSFDILKAFIFHDYALFSDNFKVHELPALQRLEQTDPDAFFPMLAYFYFKSLKIDFYENGKTHNQRCAKIIEPLGHFFMEHYPANGIAANTAYIYSQSNVLNLEVPILWNFISTLATMLQFYATPDIGRIVAKDMHIIQFLPNRTYWKSDKNSELILMRTVRHNVVGSGYYDIFKVNVDSNIVESIGVLTFLNEEILCYRDKGTGISQLGVFNIDEENILFTWEKESSIRIGNHWKRQFLKYSPSISVFDKQLTDNALNEKAFLSDGYKLLSDFSVANVTMSRMGMRLLLTNGTVYEISYASAPFIEYILPTNDVIIAERLSDGEIFVSWPQLMHCIPLSCFTKIKSASSAFNP